VGPGSPWCRCRLFTGIPTDFSALVGCISVRVISEVKIGAGPIGIFVEIMCAEVFARLGVGGLWGSVFGCFWAILDLGMWFRWVS